MATEVDNSLTDFSKNRVAYLVPGDVFERVDENTGPESDLKSKHKKRKKITGIFLLGGGGLSGHRAGFVGLFVGATLTALTGLTAISGPDAVSEIWLPFIVTIGAVTIAGFVFLVVKALLMMDYDFG